VRLTIQDFIHEFGENCPFCGCTIVNAENAPSNVRHFCILYNIGEGKREVACLRRKTSL